MVVDPRTVGTDLGVLDPCETIDEPYIDTTTASLTIVGHPGTNSSNPLEGVVATLIRGVAAICKSTPR